MSFLGGGDASCSAGSNPLAQFQKHVQDDKSLQRDRLVGRAPGGAQEGFRSMNRPGNQGNDMMDDFMQQSAHQMPGAQSSSSPFAMEQMRREFEQLHTGQAPQRNGSPANWAAEFDPGMQEQAFQQRQGGFDPSEFERYVQMKQAGMNGAQAPATQSYNNFQSRPMGMGFGGMFNGMGMGMGMMNRPSYGMQSPPLEEQQQHLGKGKGREVVELDDKDWEAQFAQMDKDAQDAVDREAELAAEAELEQIDRSVPNTSETVEPDAMLGDFERVWQNIKAETPELRRMAEEAAEWRQEAGIDLGNDWDGFSMNEFGSQLRDPDMGSYMFEDENIFKDIANPFEEGVRIMDSGGNLSLAALAFEAAVQRDNQHVEAWTRLGAAQAQNEKEAAAIRALEQAIKFDPGNLDALMGLAVSYTNEGYDSTAYRTLERWLSHKYPQIAPPNTISVEPMAADIGFTDRQALHDRVTKLFIEAAQLSPDPATMDPDVQVGLGVLFYGAEEYDKAVDCFSAALASNESGSSNSDTANQRPLLWNRLGATLANSQRSEEAIGAYEKALELNPNFVRARYNLGVSCINIGCYAEAAQHLLGALAMHKVVEKEARAQARDMLGGSGANGDAELERIIRQNQSTNLYDTLRRVFGQMDRKDLQEKVVPGVDPDIFRGEFEF